MTHHEPGFSSGIVPKRLLEDTAVAGLEHLTAFVLNHVDGVSTVSQIAYSTGLPQSEVIAMLDDLRRREIVCLES